MLTLVTGATGLVGNNVVRKLVDHGEQVRVLIRASSNRASLDGLPIDYADGDVRDVDSLKAACLGVSRVVHSAAFVEIGWTGLALQREINVEGTRNVGRAAAAVGARMAYVSSVDTMGTGTLDEPATEESPREGKTPCCYVVTKREAEAALQELVSEGLNATIVNPGFMLGPWDWKPSSGRMLLQVAKRFTPVAPTGGCSVCDVRDVADGILAALDRGEVGRNYILAGHNLSYMDLWKVFARITETRPPVVHAGPLARMAAGAVGDLVARITGREPEVNSAAIKMSSLFHYYDSARAQTELGYCNRPLDETVTDAWQWFHEHGYA